jgi:hypothetical protein
VRFFFPSAIMAGMARSRAAADRARVAGGNALAFYRLPQAAPVA